MCIQPGSPRQHSGLWGCAKDTDVTSPSCFLHGGDVTCGTHAAVPPTCDRCPWRGSWLLLSSLCLCVCCPSLGLLWIPQEQGRLRPLHKQHPQPQDRVAGCRIFQAKGHSQPLMGRGRASVRRRIFGVEEGLCWLGDPRMAEAALRCCVW